MRSGNGSESNSTCGYFDRALKSCVNYNSAETVTEAAAMHCNRETVERERVVKETSLGGNKCEMYLNTMSCVSRVRLITCNNAACITWLSEVECILEAPGQGGCGTSHIGQMAFCGDDEDGGWVGRDERECVYLCVVTETTRT